MSKKSIKKSNDISTDELEKFICELDKNPRSKNTRCCDGEGVCTTLEELEKKKR